MKQSSSFFLALLLFLPVLPLCGQTYELTPTGISLTGGMIQTNHSELRHSIGETVIESWTIEASTLRQGFQQSINRVNTSLDRADLMSGSLRLYPQPARETLTLAWEGQEVLVGSVSWFDLNGRRIGDMTQPLYLLPGETRQMDLHTLSPGTYLLMLTGEDGLPMGSWPVIRLP